MKLIDLLRVLFDMQNTEIVLCDKQNKEIERMSRMDFVYNREKQQDSDLSHFEVIGVKTQIIQTEEIAYFMDTEARIMLAVKTIIGVRKVEE